MKIKSFADIITAWGIGQMAIDLGVKYDTVRRWRGRNSIPYPEWNEMLKRARKRGVKITATDLISIGSK